ncbi:unnamed protein product [Parajaminaea phylloscopi]
MSGDGPRAPSPDAFMTQLLSGLDAASPAPAAASQRPSQRASNAHAQAGTASSPATNTLHRQADRGQQRTAGMQGAHQPPTSSDSRAPKMSLAEIQRRAFGGSQSSTSFTSSRSSGPRRAHSTNSAVIPPQRQPIASSSRLNAPIASSSQQAKPREVLKAPTPRAGLHDYIDLTSDDEDDDWMADLDEAALIGATPLKQESDGQPALPVQLQQRAPAVSVKQEYQEESIETSTSKGARETPRSNSSSSLIKRASRTQSKLWVQRASEHKTSNQIHRSYVRCRVLSVRESTYEHPLANSDRVIHRTQHTLICLERPRRGAQYRDDQGMEGEQLSTWDGRSETRHRRLILREEWTVTRVQPGDYVHCVGVWDEEQMSPEDAAELAQCAEQEQQEQQSRDQAALERPFNVRLQPGKKEEKGEDTEELPPSSFESDADLFANIDEADPWTSAPASQAKILTMYLLSASPVSKHRHADNLLILHPDTLVTATAVCDVPTCLRKPLVKHRINATGAVDKMSEAVVMGNMLHEVLQACLTGFGLSADAHTASQVPDYDSQESLLPYLNMPFPLTWCGPGRTNFSLPFLLRQVRLQVLSNLDGLLCCDMQTTTGEEKLLELCRPFGEFARKYLEDTLAAHRAEAMGQQVQGLFRGRDGMMDMSDVFKEDAVVLDSRTTVPTLARVTHVFDVEEEIWSPMYGLKGKMDVSVEVEMQETHVNRPAWRGGNHFTPGQQQGSEPAQPHTGFYRRTQSAAAAQEAGPASLKSRSVSIMPMEIKTGKSVDALEHRAQTMLYTLMMSDRYGTDVTSGLLYYTRSGDMHRVRRTRNEVRGLIVGRNELAYWLRRNASSCEDGPEPRREAEALQPMEAGGPESEGTALPPTIDNERECKRCFAQDGCMLYRRAVDRIVEDAENPSEVASLYERITGHLTPEQAAFYAKWERLLSHEESDMVRFKRELWTMTATAREETGRCFANMIMDPDQSGLDEESGGKQMKAHMYRFVREPNQGSPSASLLSGGMSPGEPCVVSIEPNTFSVAQGYIIEVSKTSVLVGLDHHLDAVLERAAVEQGKPLTTSSLDMTFRIDRDEFSDGMAKIRFALSRFFFSKLPRDARHREVIVDLAAPRFMPEEAALSPAELPAHLNEDQQRAMRKVCSAEDYALILGMPGTGKTTTIAELIRLLVARGNTILLASYTHSAVDTILRKLVKLDGVKLLRLGNVDRVHPDLQHCTVPRCTTVEELDQVINAPNVIGTTCLSTGHATFARRRFDYCIIDEASQITLPSTLGSLRFADKFVLVGDHYQLPPLVRNSNARAGGLDVSLFKRLHEAHPGATVYLTKQYRMNENIMLISNHLIYNGQLQCGNEQTAKQVLHLPYKQAALDTVHRTVHSSTAGWCGRPCPSRKRQDFEGCWLASLISEKCQAAFVDTDDVPGHESRRGRMVQNEVEAAIIQQLAHGLVLAGVPPGDIAVITPYRQQLKLLQNSLIDPERVPQTRSTSLKTAAQIKRESSFQGEKSMGGGNIEVLTADRSQGRDKPVVLISLVRSNEYGTQGIGELLNDWRRINVALTRAQRKVIIVGSKKTLSAAPLLVDFISLMTEQGWHYKLPARATEMHPAAASYPPMVAGGACNVKGEEGKVKHVGPHGTKQEESKDQCLDESISTPSVHKPIKAESQSDSTWSGDMAQDSPASASESALPLSQTSDSELNRRNNQPPVASHNPETYHRKDFIDFNDLAGGFPATLGKRKERPRASPSSSGSQPQGSARRATTFSGGRVRTPGGPETPSGEALLRSRPILRDAIRASQED